MGYRARLLVSVAAVLGGAVLVHGAARAADAATGLAVCIDSASSTAARDQALAEAVARRQNLTLSVHKFDGDGGDEGFSAKDFRALLASDCDLVLGYPLEVTDGTPPPGLNVTAPYDTTGFTLATASPLPSTGLGDLPAGTDVAVTYGTVPNLYFVTHHNVSADIHLSEADTLKTLVDGKVKAAMLWQPTIAQYMAAHAEAKLSYHALQEPHARWNIVALYGPKGAVAAAQFQAGLAALKKSGRADTRFGALPHRPFVQLAAAVAEPPRPLPVAAVAGEAGDAVPALYTAAQAKSGAAKYSDNCAQCHGDQLQGQSGPALRGALFASVKTGFSVGDILTFMAINMPATQPGSLSHDDYTDIMSYVLSQNGFPAGSTALTFDEGEKLKVPLIYHGK